MDIRIQLSRQTVKAMQRRLQDAYRRDDVRLVRRIQSPLDHTHLTVVQVFGERRAGGSGEWAVGFQPGVFLRVVDRPDFGRVG